MVVVEAAARGTPSIVVAGEDNAAIELIEEGVNGFDAPRAPARRRSPTRSCASTRRGWRCARARRAGSRDNAERLSLESSLRACSRAIAPARARSSRASACAVRSQVNRCACASPGARSRARSRARRRAGAQIAAAIAPRHAGRTAARRRRRPRAARRRSSTPRARRAPSPRAPAARSPRTARGTRRRRAIDHRPSSSAPETQPGKRTSSATPSALRTRAQLALVRGRIAGDHEHRTLLGRDPRERADQRQQVLVRPLRREAQHDAALAELEARAHVVLGQRSLALHGAQPSGHDVDPLGVEAEQLDEVLAGALRDRRSRGPSGAAAAGTSTRMPLSRMPACASGKRA